MDKKELSLIDLGKILGVEDFKNKKEFSEKFDEFINANLDEHVIHGNAIETLFYHLVRTLDSVMMIKKEDYGDDSLPPELKVPDYRVVLKNGVNLLVEVKNCRDGTVKKLKKDYVNSLIKYSKLVNASLRIAIYWGKYNLWSLNSIQDFKIDGDKYIIDLDDAYKKSEMNSIGDFLIGVAPYLSMVLKSSIVSSKKEKDKQLFEGIIDEIQISYDGKEVDDIEVKSLLFLLMLFGDFEYQKRDKILNNRIISYHYFKPSNVNNGFGLIGSLSSIMTRYYKMRIYGSESDKLKLNIKSLKLNMEILKNKEKRKGWRFWIFEVKQNKTVENV